MCDACESARGPAPALENVTVVSNERVTDGVGLLELHAPRCAASVRAGQFVHLRIDREADFILRRPFSVHRASGETIQILYQVLGRGTRAMSLLERGTALDLVGPLGTGWRVPERAEHALFVTGGLGAAPLGMLAEELARAGVAVTVAMGAPCGDRLVARTHYENVTRRVEVATDDGSAGQHGFVTVLTERLLAKEPFDVVYVCGPEAMERIVSGQAFAAGVPCQVSLERLMACGIGACLSCVVSTREGLKRACVDGPVFDAADVLWDSSEIPPRH